MKSKSKVWWKLDPPQIYSKLFRFEGNRSLDLRMLVKGIHERQGSWYVLEYQILDRVSGEQSNLGRLDWADWDKNGDLLGAREGRVYRLKPRSRDGHVTFRPESALALADFRGLSFAPRRAPDDAQVW